MPKPLTALCLAALLALAAAGCGDGDSDTAADPARTETTGTAPGTAEAESTAPKPDTQGSGGSDADGGSDSDGSAGDQGAGSGFEVEKGGDDSIQTYGSEAESAEEAAIVAATRSFFRAIAANDYPEICAGLTSANREQLELFLKMKKQQGDCATVLKTLLVRQQAPEARKAARGSIYQVRVEDDTAFVLFTPAGGAASYFVMKREDGEWKATSLATGTPFDPLP